METLTIQGRSINCELLGGGCYSQAFRSLADSNVVYVLTRDELGQDRSKEVMAYAKSLRNSKHLPMMEERGTTRLWGDTWKVFETRYSKSFREYTDLPESITPLAESFPKDKADVERESISVPKSVKEALEDIFKALEHFKLEPQVGSSKKKTYRFDMHSGNWGTDPKTDTVIFRDPLVAFF